MEFWGIFISPTISPPVTGMMMNSPPLLPQEELNIRKESGLPVYFIQYTKERVTKAKLASKASISKLRSAIISQHWRQGSQFLSLLM